MLKRKYRLVKRKQFNYIYRKGRSQHSELLTLVFSFCKMKNIKVGFSASKKIGNSVKRHRALRLMREAARPLINKMAPNNNYIFIAKEGITEKSLAEISKSVETVLKRAGLVTA